MPVSRRRPATRPADREGGGPGRARLSGRHGGAESGAAHHRVPMRRGCAGGRASRGGWPRREGRGGGGARRRRRCAARRLRGPERSAERRRRARCRRRRRGARAAAARPRRRAASSGRQPRSSLAHWSNLAGNDGVRTAPMSLACSRKRRGWPAQSSKSALAPSVATPRTRARRPRCTTKASPPVAVPASHTPSGLACLGQVVDRRPQIALPAGQAEVALALATAPEGERHGREAQLVGDAVDQLRKRARRLAGIERPGREAVAEHEARAASAARPAVARPGVAR